MPHNQSWFSIDLPGNDTHNQLESITNSNSQVKILTKQLNKRKQEMSDFSGICLECNQPLPDLEKHKEKLLQEIANIENEITDLQALTIASTCDWFVL